MIGGARIRGKFVIIAFVGRLVLMQKFSWMFSSILNGGRLPRVLSYTPTYLPEAVNQNARDRDSSGATFKERARYSRSSRLYCVARPRNACASARNEIGAPPFTIAMCSKAIVWYPCTPWRLRWLTKHVKKIIALGLVWLYWRRWWRRIWWHQNREIAFEQILACKSGCRYERAWAIYG